MQKIILLGSTGNLGQQSIKVLKKYAEHFQIIALTGYTNRELLEKQAQELSVKNYGTDPHIDLSKADIVLNCLAGIVGIEATKQALQLDKKLILANKESLIAAGEEISQLAKPGQIIPMDSEHNAIFEILHAYPEKRLQSVTLPCSGGPFFGRTRKALEKVTAKETLKHPRWNMGAKISVESATLINKGMEVLEAHYLFGLPLEKIQVKIHPECEIHGIVHFQDGTDLAYVSKPNMHEHIENALLKAIDLPTKSKSRIKELADLDYQLSDPDHQTFPGIKMLEQAFKQGKVCEFLAQEEKVVQMFLDHKINFLQIFAQLGYNQSL